MNMRQLVREAFGDPFEPGQFWSVKVASLKLFGVLLAALFVLFTVVIWVLWTVENSGSWLVWLVNMVVVGVLVHVGSDVLRDRSDNKHIEREHWCPKCGQDVKP